MIPSSAQALNDYQNVIETLVSTHFCVEHLMLRRQHRGFVLRSCADGRHGGPCTASAFRSFQTMLLMGCSRQTEAEPAWCRVQQALKQL